MNITGWKIRKGKKMSEKFILEQDAYEQTLEPSLVPFADYLNLENEKDKLEKEYEEFKTNVFYFVKDSDLGGLMKYLKKEGVF